MQFLSVLPRSLDSEQKPEFWPEGFSYPNYKGATYAKDDVNLAILESILSLYGHDKETHLENELKQKLKKKTSKKSMGSSAPVQAPVVEEEADL